MQVMAEGVTTPSEPMPDGASRGNSLTCAQSSQPTFVRTCCMRSMAKGVMNPSDPMANGASRGNSLTFVRTFCMRSMAKGVMNPSDPMAKGTSGGTGPLPRMEHVHKTVPSPPRVITQSSLSATGRGISPVSGSGSHVTRFPGLTPAAVLTLMLCKQGRGAGVRNQVNLS